MTIKAILRGGRILPLEPIPAGWAEGQELAIEEPSSDAMKVDWKSWLAEMEHGASAVSQAEQLEFLSALDENDKASKDDVRREWGLS